MTASYPPYRPATFRRFARIRASAAYVPPRQVANAELTEQYGHHLPPALLKRSIGVEVRHVAAPGEADSDLLARAARSCLERAGLAVDDLSKLMVTKFLGDRVLPFTASQVQRQLGASVAVQCLDVDGGSNSFLQALDLAARCINAGDGPILVAAGGVAHNLISHTDPRLAFLYGDAAAAILVEPATTGGILGAYTVTDTTHLDLYRATSFMDLASTRLEEPEAQARMRDLYVAGNWKEAHRSVLAAARHVVTTLLSPLNLDTTAVARFFVSETNGPLWESLLTELAIPSTKTHPTLQHHGNTLSANLPLQWALAQEACPLPEGEHALFLSIGEGLSVTALLYRA